MKTAQFTPGPTCTCEIVMRTGETLDSSLGDRPCSDISRIVLCPLHTAAPVMYADLCAVRDYLFELYDEGNAKAGEYAASLDITIEQAEGR